MTLLEWQKRAQENSAIDLLDLALADWKSDQTALKLANENLWKRLLRANPVCENMHHENHELHQSRPCPVEKWVRADFPEY